ncbi:glycerate kinase [Atlantibacter subterranea]|uniref:Glycerate kinase n=1 Tax=Atlantibacter subterraneus TaxID=255519 RepID=A0A427UPR5_9ENTR|nr:glycerate kinase [Atlantibacter subterranea]MDA3131233.1 glycerate kinase [Atlantibacter subterranea]RSB59636.1 glycerate kinase [Atlantibacter subterranea]RSE05597.1 glycerate kinase [Atlantibacter subterranea]RSE22516.1 glycerate kinase [Atlantibacter subterranea]
MAISQDAQYRGELREIFQAAIQRADPSDALRQALPEKPGGRCVVVGAGKASAAMAAVLESAWPDVALSGVVVTRYGHAVACQRIRIIEAAHPVSDCMSEMASMLALESVKDLGPDDCVIALMSGGGSALLALPRSGITLADKQALTKALLRSGATIHEINVVRKQLSDIKGGRLAKAAYPARVVTLAISDVPGDDPGDIASGPTVADNSSAAQAQAILARYQIPVPEAVRQVLDQPREPVRESDIRSEVRTIATPHSALQAAAQMAEKLGYTPLILGDALEGESAQMGIMMAGIARSVKRHGLPVKPPAILLSGGETTVTLGSSEGGRGGRNCEFLLSLAVALKGEAGIWAIAGDSDGIDGTEDAAGAVIGPDTLTRGPDAGAFLDAHDSYSYFAAQQALVITGPTLTNVNDIRAILIAPEDP